MAGESREQLESSIGYRFSNPERLERALTHTSRIAENSPPRIDAQAAMPGGESFFRPQDAGSEDNEKFEFLGDAVLTLVVSERLLADFPDWQEGRLSRARASLVNSDALAAVARQMEIGAHLRLGRGEEKTGGREKSSLLADAYEAIVAAVYLDGGLDAARGFIGRSFLNEALRQTIAGGGGLGEGDFKSRLQEFLQARGWPSAEYHIVMESGPDHRKFFEVEAHVTGRAAAIGTGMSKKEAEQAAARGALSQLLAADAAGSAAIPAAPSRKHKEENG
jgi:ribonuclease III